MEKKIIAVGNQDGIQQAACPKCDTVMVWRDNYHMSFGGEVEESGGEYLECPKCGLRADDYDDGYRCPACGSLERRETDIENGTYHYICTDCGKCWTVKEKMEV